MLPPGPAIVLVMDPPMVRVAAFVYRTRAGLGWVEPGYWDRYPPPSPQWHEFAGQVVDTDCGVVLQGGDQTIVVFDADRVKGTERDDPEARQLIERLGARMAEMGTTFAEQRILLASQLPVFG